MCLYVERGIRWEKGTAAGGWSKGGLGWAEAVRLGSISSWLSGAAALTCPPPYGLGDLLHYCHSPLHTTQV